MGGNTAEMSAVLAEKKCAILLVLLAIGLAVLVVKGEEEGAGVRRFFVSTLAGAAVVVALLGGPAAGEATVAPDWVEPGMGQPSDPSCQGEDRSTRARSEPGRQGALASSLATGTEYGVGDNVTAHHTQHGSCA